MQDSALNSLRSEFLQEAQSASRLFADLAKVEQYSRKLQNKSTN